MASIWLLIMWLQHVTKHIEYLGAVTANPEGPPWILHAVLVAALC